MKCITAFFLFAIPFWAAAQKSDLLPAAQQKVSESTPYFSIIKLGNIYSRELITLAFTKADMCGSFYETKFNDIVFDDGTIVRLIPKKDFRDAHIPAGGCFVPDSFRFPPFIWSIHPSGWLMKGSANKANKKSN